MKDFELNAGPGCAAGRLLQAVATDALTPHNLARSLGAAPIAVFRAGYRAVADLRLRLDLELGVMAKAVDVAVETWHARCTTSIRGGARWLARLLSAWTGASNVSAASRHLLGAIRVCLLLGGLHAALGCSDATAVVGTYRTPSSGGDGHPAGGSSGASADAGQSDGASGSMTGAAGRVETQHQTHDETIQIATGSRDQFCAGHGPALSSHVTTIGGASEPQCTAGIGRRLFPYALCSCSDLTLSGISGAIDSTRDKVPRRGEAPGPSASWFAI
jgi:hypothetical protein